MGRSGEGNLLFSFYNRTEKAKVIPQPWCGRGNAAHAQPRGSPAGSAPSTLPFPSPRRRLTPPGPPSPVGGPAGRVTPRMEGHELATPEETGVSGLAPDPPVGGAGRTLLPASKRVQPLSPAFHTSSENMPPCLGKKSSRQENLISSSSFRTASGTDAPHTPPLMVMGGGGSEYSCEACSSPQPSGGALP